MLPLIKPYKPAAVGAVEPEAPMATPKRDRSHQHRPVARTPDPRRMLASSSAAPPNDKLLGALTHMQLADRVHQPDLTEQTGYEELMRTFHSVVEHNSDAAAKEGRSIQESFRSIAKHVKAYQHDGLAGSVGATCERILDTAVTQRRTTKNSNAAADEHLVTRGFASSVLVAVDQLLSLLAHRDPCVAPTIVRARGMLHQLVLVDPADTTPDPAARSGSTRSCFRPDGLPKLIKERRGDSSDPSQSTSTVRRQLEVELSAAYDGRRTFAETTAQLIERLGVVKKEADAAVSRLHSVRIAGRKVASLSARSALLRAFAGWRGAVAFGKMVRRFDSELLGQRDHLLSVEGVLARTSAKRDFEMRSGQARTDALRSELLLMRHQYDAYKVVADQAKHESEDLRRQVHDLQRGAVLRLQQRIDSLEGEVETWRVRAASFAHDTAAAPWETFNRWRVQSIAFPSGQASTTAATPAVARTPARRAGGGTGATAGGISVIDPVTYPPAPGCDAAKAVAIAEALAQPFVGLVYSAAPASHGGPVSSKKGRADRPARQKACFHAVTGLAVFDLLVLLHAISPGHLPIADVRKLLSLRDEVNAAKRVTALLRDFGIDLYGIGVAALPAATKAQLELVVTNIIARFSGLAPTCAFLPPLPNECQVWGELVTHFRGSPFDVQQQQHAGGAEHANGASLGQAVARTPKAGAMPNAYDELLSPGAKEASPTGRPSGGSPPQTFGSNLSIAAPPAGLSPMSDRSMVSPTAGGRAATNTAALRHMSVNDFLRWSREAAQSLARWRAFGAACLGEAVMAALTAAETPPEPPLTSAQAMQVAEIRQLRHDRLDGFPLSLRPDEIESLQTEILAQGSARALRRVFIFYATGGAGAVDLDPRMSIDEFERFLDDALLIEEDNPFNKATAYALMKESAASFFPSSTAAAGGSKSPGTKPVNPSITASPSNAPSPAKGAKAAAPSAAVVAAAAAMKVDPSQASELQLGPQDFVEWLVRVADAKRRIAQRGDVAAFDKESAPSASDVLELSTLAADDARTDADFTDPEGGLKAALKAVVEDYVLRNCSGGSPTDGVGRMMRSAPVAEFLADAKPMLRKLFRVYAAADATAVDAELSSKEFLKLAVDAGLVTLTDAQAAASVEGGALGPLAGGGSGTRAANKTDTDATAGGARGVVSATVVHQLFYRVLESSEAASDHTDGQGAGGIRQGSWHDLVCALALVVTPSPFTAFHHKLRTLVDGYLRPVANGDAAKGKRGK